MELRQTPRLDSAAGETRRPLKAIALLPSIATLGNLLCGALAVLCCMLSMRSAYFTAPARAWPAPLAEFVPSYLAAGCALIVIAMIFDALDGRLARIARHTTEFGAQLDSIADIVSFGLAPAALFLTLMLRLAVPNEGEPLVGKLDWRLALLAVLVYIACAAIRLARYNAENIKDESAQRRFSGLPVPGAAGAVVALLLLHEDLAHAATFGVAHPLAAIARWSLIFVSLGLAILMVSRVPYTHVFNEYVRRETPAINLAWLLLVVGAIGVYWPQILLVVLAAIYVLGCPIVWLLRRRSGAASGDADVNELN